MGQDSDLTRGNGVEDLDLRRPLGESEMECNRQVADSTTIITMEKGYKSNNMQRPTQASLELQGVLQFCLRFLL